MKIDKVEIEKRFSYHAPKDGQSQKYDIIRKGAKHLALVLVANVPESRELSLALTKLEECVMHANSGIARRS